MGSDPGCRNGGVNTTNTMETERAVFSIGHKKAILDAESSKIIILTG